jgi:hypothetical protein
MFFEKIATFAISITRCKNWMSRIVFIIISVVYSIQILNAQTERPAIIQKLQKKEGGQVQVIQDNRIDQMMLRITQQNAGKNTIRGFRVKIFSDYSADARKLANEARGKFITYFPETETYIDIKAPDWRVYVGNYRTITDALRAKKQIEKYFGSPIIIEADIDINKI